MKNLIYLLALIGAVGTAIYVTDYLHGQRLEEVVERQNEAALQFGVAFDSATSAYEARAQQVFDQQEIIEELEDTNAELTRDLEASGAEVVTLSKTVGRLRARMGGEAQGREDGGGVRVAISDTARYERGSELSVTGYLFLDPSTLLADYQLDIAGELYVGTTVSRLPDNALRVDVWSDAPMTFHTIEVTHNLSDPIHERTRVGFFDGLVDPGSVVTALAGFLLGRL